MYWLRLPFNPDEMIGRCSKPFILNDLLSSFVNDTFVLYPFTAIPYPHASCYLLNRNETNICQYQAAFGNARKFRYLPFLPEMSIDAVFLDRYMKHLAGTGAVDILAPFKNIQPPILTGQPGDHAGFDG